ncbi:MAG: hypothetical protein B0A82_03975 [Alkalinema sp. CACIAM 70d]|nr:MAG: hypothetical protein B0A82_03975 [Alkalinema sp. CACIAM 70d]
MNPNSSPFWPDDLEQWRKTLAVANYNNILCHCRECDREWVASTTEETCECGSQRIQYLPCWQFPDD